MAQARPIPVDFCKPTVGPQSSGPKVDKQIKDEKQKHEYFQTLAAVIIRNTGFKTKLNHEKNIRITG